FLGWSKTATATEAEYVESGTFGMPDSDVTLYAVWEIAEVETIPLNVRKYWYDSETQSQEPEKEPQVLKSTSSSMRPGSITVHLLDETGNLVDTTVITYDAEYYEWFGQFEVSANISDEELRNYKIEEEVPDNYIYSFRSDGFDGFELYNIEVMDIPVTKVWNGPVGGEVEVVLLDSEGEPTDYTLTLNKNNGWKDSFKLPKYEIGEYWGDFTELKYDGYEVVEKPIAGYTPEVTGNIEDGFVVTNTYNDEEPGKYYVEIKIEHFTRDGNSAPVKYGNTVIHTKNVAVTSGTAIVSSIKGDGYSITISGYRYVESSPTAYPREVIDITSGSAITGSALKTYEFQLFYDRNRPSRPDRPDRPTIIEDPEIPLADLDKVDHFAYVIGYPDGEVKPMGKITREEVAMIFYRLLTDDSRDEWLSDVNPFTDLSGHDWSNRAISTLYNAGIIKGYPNGTFKPSDPISRAEFATIAAKFDELELQDTTKFTDIFGHWAEKYITSSEIKGWVKGYPDLTFKPEQDITRAEAMTLINNVLERAVPAENIHPDAIFWPDMTSDDWYYEAVMEATNSHDYIYEEDGDELWTGMKANKVWP
ncbi:S-layer homology domain-containing protein, partial [Sedimentibacter sp.]|uniref:S-layer homology domain-containing protein n=1 Tax=Sedimentibacter sp. TaxID=1960295 RepID=UPI00289C7938